MEILLIGELLIAGSLLFFMYSLTKIVRTTVKPYVIKTEVFTEMDRLREEAISYANSVSGQNLLLSHFIRIKTQNLKDFFEEVADKGITKFTKEQFKIVFQSYVLKHKQDCIRCFGEQYLQEIKSMFDSELEDFVDKCCRLIDDGLNTKNESFKHLFMVFSRSQLSATIMRRATFEKVNEKTCLPTYEAYIEKLKSKKADVVIECLLKQNLSKDVQNTLLILLAQYNEEGQNKLLNMPVNHDRIDRICKSVLDIITNIQKNDK